MSNGLAPHELLPAGSELWTPMQLKDWEEKEALRWAVGTHPRDQAHLYIPHALYDWQVDALCASAKVHSRGVLSTANESGKTSVLIPVFGLSCMCAFPGCQIYSTSGSDRQVREQLFEQQLRPMIESARMQAAGWRIRISSQLMKVTAPNGSSWLGYVCANDLNVEGFHGYWRTDGEGKKRYYPCVYIVDEAKSVGDGVHDAIRRIDPDFWLTVSTPGSENGWFYDAVDPDNLRMAVKEQ